jgi:hypothetical protein
MLLKYPYIFMKIQTSQNVQDESIYLSPSSFTLSLSSTIPLAIFLSFFIQRILSGLLYIFS